MNEILLVVADQDFVNIIFMLINTFHHFWCLQKSCKALRGIEHSTDVYVEIHSCGVGTLYIWSQEAPPPPPSRIRPEVLHLTQHPAFYSGQPDNLRESHKQGGEGRSPTPSPGHSGASQPSHQGYWVWPCLPFMKLPNSPFKALFKASGHHHIRWQRISHNREGRHSVIL